MWSLCSLMDASMGARGVSGYRLIDAIPTKTVEKVTAANLAPFRNRRSLRTHVALVPHRRGAPGLSCRPSSTTTYTWHPIHPTAYPPSTQNSMSASAQQSFRSQLSGFRWANSVQDDSPAAAAQQPQGVFGRAWGGLSGYIPLRNEGRSQEEEAYFALSVS